MSEWLCAHRWLIPEILKAGASNARDCQSPEIHASEPTGFYPLSKWFSAECLHSTLKIQNTNRRAADRACKLYPNG